MTDTYLPDDWTAFRKAVARYPELGSVYLCLASVTEIAAELDALDEIRRARVCWKIRQRIAACHERLGAVVKVAALDAAMSETYHREVSDD